MKEGEEGTAGEIGLLFLCLLILRVYWGWNCFIALWRMVCSLGSSEQHYPWRMGDTLVLGEGKVGCHY